MEFKLSQEATSNHWIVAQGSVTWHKLLEDGIDLDNLVKEGSARLISRLPHHYYIVASTTNQKKQQKVYRQLLADFDDFMSNAVVDLRGLEEEEAKSIVYSLAVADYQLGRYKNDTQPLKNHVLEIISDQSQAADWIQEAQTTGDVVKRTMALVDAPANVKTPQYLADWAEKSAQAYGYQVEVLNLEQLKKEGLHALMAVGQGSVNPPVLLKIHWRPQAQQEYQLGLVGKGVTFDTGGISLKKPTNMHYMKSDMGGAAAVLGTMELAARLQVPVNLVAVVPLAENAVDANSIRPGDVIQSYSGKSIEIIDTDAEGRLILADALSYISSNYQPQVLLDLATLTGSVVATLGSAAAGVFTNNHDLRNALLTAGAESGERLWPLPLWEDFEEDLHSDVADVKNYSGKPIAGAITAAKFLEYFVKEFPAWAHMDIAGTAFDQVSGKMKSATGFGVRLIHAYIKSIQKPA